MAECTPARLSNERSDQVFARLGQHLHQHIIGNATGIDQPADEIEFGRSGGRESDFDLLEADFDQQIEKTGFLFRAHRIDQRLVAIAQVG